MYSEYIFSHLNAMSYSRHDPNSYSRHDTIHSLNKNLNDCADKSPPTSLSLSVLAPPQLKQQLVLVPLSCLPAPP